MFLRTQFLPESSFAGFSVEMSLAQNKTVSLWQKFMPQRKAIKSIDDFLYSIEVYPSHYFESFDPTKSFVKWAAVRVENGSHLYPDFERLTLPEGEYAVFLHIGPPQNAPNTYGYILSEWLPNSGFELDNRPHMAIMGEKYKHGEPDSEEEFWIPIKKRD
ncbi:MAG: GyrI-like domain-containing protein [Flavobacteriia bacterium]|nr:GyrI-like domain-containing protein [Flavobacteriia bacterium]